MTRMALDQAQTIVTDFCQHLDPHVERSLVAGSIRRQRLNVKDAEIVIMPTARTVSFLEQAVTQRLVTKAVYDDGRMRWGPKYWGFDYRGLRIEVFSADAINWGYILWLRTGPGDANQEVMIRMGSSQYRCKGGYLWFAPDGWRRWKDEWVSDSARRVRVPDEQTWFSLMGFTVAPYPWEREVKTYAGRVLFPEPPPESLMEAPAPKQLSLW